MIVKQRYVKKSEVTFCKETDLASTVLEKLDASGYRCIPILDKKSEKFIGNAYKVDILEFQKKYGEKDVPISELAKDQDGTIEMTSSFYKVFLKIKQLPFLAVTDEFGNFHGIMTHSKVFELLEEAWGYNAYLIGIKTTTEYFHNLFCQLAATAIYIDVRFFVPFHTVVVSLCGGQLHGAESS